MRAILSRALSVVVVALYVLIASQEGTEGLLATCGGVLAATAIPLLMIWFPDALGNFTGYIGRGGNVDVRTPPGLMAALGWIALLGLPLLPYLLR